MNLNKAPFNDPLVREAVSYAVNQQELETSVFDGLETAAETLFTNEKPNCGVEVKTYPTDMEKAKQLMKEAGYEDTKMTVSWRRTELLSPSFQLFSEPCKC